jgi:hypothetical protein
MRQRVAGLELVDEKAVEHVLLAFGTDSGRGEQRNAGNKTGEGTAAAYRVHDGNLLVNDRCERTGF